MAAAAAHNVVYTARRASLYGASSHRWRLACAPGAGPPVAVDSLPDIIASQHGVVQNPAQHGARYSDAIKAFVASAVLAYECGYSEEVVRARLAAALPADDCGAGGRAEACWELVSLVWTTLQLSPAKVRRWAEGPCQSDASTEHWRGFVSMIITGYFEQRMSWFPLERLSLERAYTTGRQQRHELVAEAANIVFTALQQVAPMFPSS